MGCLFAMTHNDPQLLTTKSAPGNDLTAEGMTHNDPRLRAWNGRISAEGVGEVRAIGPAEAERPQTIFYFLKNAYTSNHSVERLNPHVQIITADHSQD